MVKNPHFSGGAGRCGGFPAGRGARASAMTARGLRRRLPACLVLQRTTRNTRRRFRTGPPVLQMSAKSCDNFWLWKRPKPVCCQCLERACRPFLRPAGRQRSRWPGSPALLVSARAILCFLLAPRLRGESLPPTGSGGRGEDRARSWCRRGEAAVDLAGVARLERPPRAAPGLDPALPSGTAAVRSSRARAGGCQHDLCSKEALVIGHVPKPGIRKILHGIRA
jgi:hypothetical protein